MKLAVRNHLAAVPQVAPVLRQLLGADLEVIAHGANDVGNGAFAVTGLEKTDGAVVQHQGLGFLLVDQHALVE